MNTKKTLKDNFSKEEIEMMEKIVAVKKEYDNSRLSLSDAQDKIYSICKELSAEQIAYIEQELKEFEEDECSKEDIKEMLKVFDKVRIKKITELPDWHPISEYKKENAVIKDVFKKINSLDKNSKNIDEFKELFSKLMNYKFHLSRKQNQLYPILEKKGFDRPSTIMWTLDDFIMDEIKKTNALLMDKNYDEFFSMQESLRDDVLDLISKEEEVLYETSLKLISEEEFIEMTYGDREIGFSNIEANDLKTMKNLNSDFKQDTKKDLEEDLISLLKKHGMSLDKKDELLDVATGRLSLEEINLIYKHLPVDLSYVDENNKVKFYTDTEHRIFPRSKNVIGREVKFCHPPKSVHLVEEIIEKFRSGKENSVDFWINKEDLFIYIKYVAVRDENGNYKGVLEMMQEASHIRSLEGDRTLLIFDEKNKKNEKKVETESIYQAPLNQGNSNERFEITENTKMQDLLQRKESLKSELIAFNDKFKMMNSPLFKVLIKKATVKMASERSGVELNELIGFLDKQIND